MHCACLMCDDCWEELRHAHAQAGRKASKRGRRAPMCDGTVMLRNGWESQQSHTEYAGPPVWGGKRGFSICFLLGQSGDERRQRGEEEEAWACCSLLADCVRAGPCCHAQCRTTRCRATACKYCIAQWRGHRGHPARLVWRT